MAQCRVCPEEILWAINEHTGRRFPLDPLSTPGGNVLVSFLESPPKGHVMTKAEREQKIEEAAANGRPTPMFYVEHHATCSGVRKVNAGELKGQAALF